MENFIIIGECQELVDYCHEKNYMVMKADDNLANLMRSRTLIYYCGPQKMIDKIKFDNELTVVIFDYVTNRQLKYDPELIINVSNNISTLIDFKGSLFIEAETGGDLIKFLIKNFHKTWSNTLNLAKMIFPSLKWKGSVEYDKYGGD